MDDKTFIASYAAAETMRINERMKQVFDTGQHPTQEECDAVIADIEKTLQRIQSALSQITPEMLAELEDDDEYKSQ